MKLGYDDNTLIWENGGKMNGCSSMRLMRCIYFFFEKVGRRGRLDLLCRFDWYPGTDGFLATYVKKAFL